MKYGTVAVATLFAAALATQSAAAVIDTNGAESTRGKEAMIIDAPDKARAKAGPKNAVYAFNEVQSFTLTEDLLVDYDVIKEGTVVSSHMVFLTSKKRGVSAGVKDIMPTFTFDGEILGVMSDRKGRLEALSTLFLGAEDTRYSKRRALRGLEKRDSYEVDGDTLSVSLRGGKRGDWVRVITASAETGETEDVKKEEDPKKTSQAAAPEKPEPSITPVPVPAGGLMLGSLIVGAVAVSGLRRRKRS